MHLKFALPGVPAFGKLYLGAYMDTIDVIRMDVGCVNKDIESAPVRTDEAKTFLLVPAIHRSIQGLSWWSILMPGLF